MAWHYRGRCIAFLTVANRGRRVSFAPGFDCFRDMRVHWCFGSVPAARDGTPNKSHRALSGAKMPLTPVSVFRRHSVNSASAVRQRRSKNGWRSKRNCGGRARTLTRQNLRGSSRGGWLEGNRGGGHSPNLDAFLICFQTRKLRETNPLAIQPFRSISAAASLYVSPNESEKYQKRHVLAVYYRY